MRPVFEWNIGSRVLTLGKRTLIMGVVNVTPDSFSDGGQFLDPEKAFAQALHLLDEGADIIDIGGESTRPGAKVSGSGPTKKGEPPKIVSEKEELERVLPVIQRIKQERPKAVISIDTYKANVARAAVEAGAEIVNDVVDPTFRFMTADWDGKIRMDCSSPYAMASLIAMRDRFDVAFANDTDADRHGIVTRSGGLMNPNHFLATAIAYLFRHRPQWAPHAAIGKTVVSSSIIDRVAAKLGRKLVETPVGFKWFVEGLGSGSFGFAGEESAGASFLRRDGAVWTTDKDGIILGLLAAEILAKTGRDPSQLFTELTAELGVPFYERIDVPATPQQKNALKSASPERLNLRELAGDPVRATRTTAPGNGRSGTPQTALPLGSCRCRPSPTAWRALRRATGLPR